MGDKQIRLGQLIAPFGPGSLYTDRRGYPHVVCGLDLWHQKCGVHAGMVPADDLSEFEFTDLRIANVLKIDRFRLPPDFRFVRAGQAAPKNAWLKVPALRFPCWYRNTMSGELKRFTLATQRIEKPSGGGKWLPVRFIALCKAGHLCEFPWKRWIGCDCEGDGKLVLHDFGGSDLTSIRVACGSCAPGSPGRRGKNLAGVTRQPAAAAEQSAFQAAGINCSGDRPWLGEGRTEPCAQPLVGGMINQTNIYFPKVFAAIGLPDLPSESAGLAELVASINRANLNTAMTKMMWRVNKDDACIYVCAKLHSFEVACEAEQVAQALPLIFDGPGFVAVADAATPEQPESEQLAFRRAEFDVLRRTLDRADAPDLRVREAEVPHSLTTWISRVNLVEKLKETRVFFGFDRLRQDDLALGDMPASALKQLFRWPTEEGEAWLPAIRVYGEGVYVELNAERLSLWQRESGTWLAKRLEDRFLARLATIHRALPPLGGVTLEWASRYLLVHSFAHILINQMVFECGYSTAALRERLFVSADPSAPMAGLLIYTAAGDSEGTLGGLVRLGRPERFGPLVQRALARAAWCSADPICSEQLGGQGSMLANQAACHGCILLPETSCETTNHALDRAMAVGLPDCREVGFFSDLVKDAVGLE